MERQKFENEWKDAFAGSEIEPADSVWTNVELALEKEAGGKMKRRLLFFQLLAAASMVFALGVGGVYFLQGSSASPSDALAVNAPATRSSAAPASEERTSPAAAEEALTQANLNQTSSGDNQQNISRTHSESNDTRGDQHAGNSTNTNSSLYAGLNSQNDMSRYSTTPGGSPGQENGSTSRVSPVRRYDYLAYADRKPSLVSYHNPTLNFEKNQPDAGELLLARLADEERKYQEQDKKKKNSKERMWTSLAVGAGTFNPNSSAPASTASLGAAGSRPVSSNPTRGMSYSMNVMMGGRLTNRIVLQGGVTYLSQNSAYTSSASLGTAATLNEFVDANTKISATSPYKVNSNIQYLAVPVQAGFVVLNRALGWQLNGGVSTDFFIQNTLTPESSSRLQRTTQSAGADSPFRTVNFSGLIGTEISYRFAEHYRIALNPGMRYALNSIYKSDVLAQISPVTFDVSLRFRYIIR